MYYFFIRSFSQTNPLPYVLFVFPSPPSGAPSSSHRLTLGYRCRITAAAWDHHPIPSAPPCPGLTCKATALLAAQSPWVSPPPVPTERLMITGLTDTSLDLSLSVILKKEAAKRSQEIVLKEIHMNVNRICNPRETSTHFKLILRKIRHFLPTDLNQPEPKVFNFHI